MVGTLQTSVDGIPPYLKETKSKEILTSEIFWEKTDPEIFPDTP